MRRFEDGHAQRPPPFRVLAAPDYLSPTAIPPPPPRAPEPYKIAPSSTSSSRAHRRSSFVIIADSRPGSPETRSPSPTLATGRVSPFRGRGFKGPPPRSRSRPQSPEIADGRRRGRNERRGKIYSCRFFKRGEEVYLLYFYYYIYYIIYFYYYIFIYYIYYLLYRDFIK